MPEVQDRHTAGFSVDDVRTRSRGTGLHLDADAAKHTHPRLDDATVPDSLAHGVKLKFRAQLDRTLSNDVAPSP